MNGAKELLLARMNDAKKCLCWRVVCARIRDLAKLREREEGVPYEQTLEEYNYEYYKNSIKRKFYFK